MKTAKSFKKPFRALTSFVLVAVMLVTVNMPFAAMAEVDDIFESGNLAYLVISEGSGDANGTVIAAFNENVDPETVTKINVPRTVDHDGKSYSVTALSDSAFGGCTALKTLDLTACKDLNSIGMSAFIDCESLKSIIIPCNFDKTLFTDTGVVADGDSFRIEYSLMGDGGDRGAPTTVTVVSDGAFTYVHDWQMYDKNYAQHICKGCSKKGKHTWKADADNSSQHKCTVCGGTEQHYGGTPNCDGTAKCAACSTEYQTKKQGAHQWQVMPETIGNTTAEFECTNCAKTEKQDIAVGDSKVNCNGQKLKIVLQDPYKVLPEGVQVKSKSVEPGSARYNELLAHIDDTHRVENIAFFEIELYNAKNEKISGEIAGKVRILMQIPDGWDKRDLEAVLVMAGADVEFEESVITIDGVDYLAFWTDHFSPYAMIETATNKNNKKTSPATGNNGAALATVCVSAAIVGIVSLKRKIKAQ